MKKLGGFVLAGWFLLVPGYWIPAAWAADPVVEPADVSSEPAVINHPGTGYDLVKSFADYLEPGADWFVTFTEGGPIEGLSGAIYTAKSKGFPIASLRAGYGLTDKTTYASIALDLNGLASRFLPTQVKNLSPGVLTSTLAFAGKYLRVGPAVGYDWDAMKPRWGVTLGAAWQKSF